MLQRHSHRCSLQEFIKALEADIHHANSLLASLPRDITGIDSVHMKLYLTPFTPFLLFLTEWIGFSCLDPLIRCLGLSHILVNKVYIDDMPKSITEERKATLRQFYAVIYPMLKQLEESIRGLMEDNLKQNDMFYKISSSTNQSERDDDDCGICMEMDSKVVLPICSHSMCINCFDEWHVRSQSCPFCRGSLKRATSRDLWVLTSKSEVIDTKSLVKENMRSFYSYIDELPHVETSDDLLLYNYLM